MAFDPFPEDALDANRRGALSDRQTRGFGAASASRHRSAFGSAALLVAGGLVVAFFASPTTSQAARILIPAACFAIAGILVVRAVTGADALTRDVRHGQVRSVEGAIGKRRTSSGGQRARTLHFLDVGAESFKVGSLTFAAAPDAGYVRVYFLPLSRTVVNLERVPGPRHETDVTLPNVLATAGAVLLSPTREQRNEARAALSDIGDALKATMPESPTPPPASARDPRPLAEAIVGTWSNGMITVEFAADGRLTAHLFTGDRSGHWSVDAQGRLRADITGGDQAADAWIAGNELTVVLDGRGLVLQRQARSL